MFSLTLITLVFFFFPSLGSGKKINHFFEKWYKLKDRERGSLEKA